MKNGTDGTDNTLLNGCGDSLCVVRKPTGQVTNGGCRCSAGTLRAVLSIRNSEIRELKNWVADLQSGMYVNCVYCGHRYGPEDEVPVSMAEVLKQHIEVCPKHPMSELKRELAKAKEEAGKNYEEMRAETENARENYLNLCGANMKIDALQAEIERLRALVKTAYEEGGRDETSRSLRNKFWDQSDAKKALEVTI